MIDFILYFMHYLELLIALDKWKSVSHIGLFAIPWIIQSMEFSRPEYWSG